MFTSNFARVDRLPKSLRPVSIARKPGRYYKGDAYLALAPTAEMLQMSIPRYIVEFDAIIAKLDPNVVLSDLGDNAVMLCWESPGIFCHRRRVAQWLEESLGIEIPEYGFARESYPSYPEMPLKGSPEGKKYPRALETANHDPYNPLLF